MQRLHNIMKDIDFQENMIQLYEYKAGESIFLEISNII